MQKVGRVCCLTAMPAVRAWCLRKPPASVWRALLPCPPGLSMSHPSRNPLSDDVVQGLAIQLLIQRRTGAHACAAAFRRWSSRTAVALAVCQPLACTPDFVSCHCVMLNLTRVRGQVGKWQSQMDREHIRQNGSQASKAMAGWQASAAWRRCIRSHSSLHTASRNLSPHVVLCFLIEEKG